MDILLREKFSSFLNINGLIVKSRIEFVIKLTLTTTNISLVGSVIENMADDPRVSI